MLEAPASSPRASLNPKPSTLEGLEGLEAKLWCLLVTRRLHHPRSRPNGCLQPRPSPGSWRKNVRTAPDTVCRSHHLGGYAPFQFMLPHKWRDTAPLFKNVEYFKEKLGENSSIYALFCHWGCIIRLSLVGVVRGEYVHAREKDLHSSYHIHTLRIIHKGVLSKSSLLVFKRNAHSIWA